MASYVSLVSFTDQGIRAAKQTTQRAEAFTAQAEKAGVKVRELLYTIGQYDLVVVLEAPSDETVTSLLLSVGSLGNVRTQTLRGFSKEEMAKIIQSMP